MSAIDVSHAIAQADLALGTAGLRPDNILRRELRASGAAVAELIAACHERDEAQQQYDLSDEFYGEDSNHKEMRAARGRIRTAVKRYLAALANIGAAP